MAVLLKKKNNLKKMKMNVKSILTLTTVLISHFLYGQHPDNMHQTQTGKDAKPFDVQGVEKILGRKLNKMDGFYRVDFPRKDLKVKIGDVAIEPGLAFGSWLAFLPMNGKAMLMGDMVLLETEAEAVLKKIYEQGIQIAAMHNHLLTESPKIIYIHVTAMEDPLAIAAKMKAVYSVTATPMDTLSSAKPKSEEVNWGRVEDLMKVKGKHDGKLLKFSFSRKEKIQEHGVILPAKFGINTVINFQKTGDKAAITGDFVLTGEEVNKVAKVLTQNGITVTAMHNHMLFEQPRLFFMHFWAVDDAEKLAAALRKAVEQGNHVLE
jgi:hypothetical protein